MKIRITLTVEKKVIQLAKKSKLNISQFLEQTLLKHYGLKLEKEEIVLTPVRHHNKHAKNFEDIP